MKNRGSGAKGKLLFAETGHPRIIKHRRITRIIFGILGTILWFQGFYLVVYYKFRLVANIYAAVGITIGTLFLVHLPGYTDLKVYENGISMPFRPVWWVLKNEEYFMPFEKISKISIRKNGIWLYPKDENWAHTIINRKAICNVAQFTKIVVAKGIKVEHRW